MKKYGLFIKNSDEVISNISLKNIEEAKHFFLNRKMLLIEDFDKIFEIKLIK